MALSLKNLLSHRLSRRKPAPNSDDTPSNLRAFNSSRRATSLSPTLLKKIFLTACLPSNDMELPAMMMNGKNMFGTRRSISHVCHSWRELALSTPLLWNCIYVYIFKCHGALARETLFPSIPSLRIAIERSKNLPLHLRFTNDCEKDPDLGPDLLPILREILPRCAIIQVYEMSVKYWEWDLPNILLGSNDRPLKLPHLQSFLLRDRSLLGVNLSNSPELRQLWLQGKSILPQTRIPSNLERLALHKPTSLDTILEPLRNSETLKTLLINEYDVNTKDVKTPNIPLVLPALEELSYTANLMAPRNKHLSKLAYIVTPNIHTLQIHHRWQFLVPNQFPRLRCLDLRQASIEPEALESLKFVPTVIELGIWRCHAENRGRLFSGAFTRRSGDLKTFDLLPNLRMAFWEFKSDHGAMMVEDIARARNDGRWSEDDHCVPYFVVHVDGDPRRGKHQGEFQLFMQRNPHFMLERAYVDPFLVTNWNPYTEG